MQHLSRQLIMNTFAVLLFSVPPEITQFRMPDDLSEGKRLTLMCSVSAGTPPITFSWHKDGSPIGNVPNIRVVHVDEYQDNLQIEKLTTDHIGNYTCNAKNLYGSDHLIMRVIMRFPPKWSNNENQPNQTINGVVGANFTMNCSVIAHPAAAIKFKFGMYVIFANFKGFLLSKGYAFPFFKRI